MQFTELGHLKPEKAAAESEPETVLPGPRSLSDPVEAYASALAKHKAAQEVWRAAYDEGYHRVAELAMAARHRLRAEMRKIEMSLREGPKGNS